MGVRLFARAPTDRLYTESGIRSKSQSYVSTLCCVR